jgi:hypothetical protein
MFKWETDEERLLRFMMVPPKKKLEWLRQINKFITNYTSKRNLIIKQKLRDVH